MDESHSWAAVAEIIASKTDWTTLLVAITAGMIGAYGNYWVWSRQAAAEKRSIRASLLAEVRSMLEIIERRRYLQALKDTHQTAVTYGQRISSEAYAFEINIPDGYNRVYQANLSRLGALSTVEAFQVVRFHQLVESLVADLVEGGAMRKGSNDPDLWSDGVEILEQAIRVGEELTSERRWHARWRHRLWTLCGRGKDLQPSESKVQK